MPTSYKPLSMAQEYFDDFSSESDSSPLDVLEIPLASKYEIDVSKLNRPPNSFLLFSNEQRLILRKQHPDLNNTEISRMLGGFMIAQDLTY